VHLIVEDTRSLDAAEIAEDLGQSPADIVFLSFSDSDLAAFASAWKQSGVTGPSLRLANLNRLKHPYSVDLYVERTIAAARVVIIRLLGGLDYWRYGVDECAAIARAKGIRLAIVPGDYREDGRLDAASTMDTADLNRIWQWFQAGGPGNMRSAVAFAHDATGFATTGPRDWSEPVAVGACGSLLEACRGEARGLAAGGREPLALVLLYRSIVAAADTAPFPDLADALHARGLNVATRFVTSLKDPTVVADLGHFIDTARPDVIVNTTAFSARLDDGTTVIDRADCAVLQAMLSTSSLEAWAASGRGLSAADLAMNVVLPELDGRIITTALSFKAAMTPDPALEFSRLAHRPEPDRIALVADRAARWARLRQTPNAEKSLALILSNYPAKAGRTGYAVGLDTQASTYAIAEALRGEGYDVGDLPGDLIAVLEGRSAMVMPIALPLDSYNCLFATLPEAFRASVIATHGEPDRDLKFPVIQAHNLIVALQPDRGRAQDRKDEAHDLTRPPGHAYIGFYLWLRVIVGIDALIHLGTHGTLEWLPGKAVALDAASAPEAILGPIPVLYPFIVNNPGEAAQARRRIAAVTVGHLTPPLMEAGTYGDAAEIEAWLDEYAQAQALDPRRARKLAEAILDKARACGLAAEIGLTPDAEPGEALQRLDARICDIKEMRVGDGLHTFGRGPDQVGRAATVAALAALSGADASEVANAVDRSAPGEIAGLLAGLAGRFIAPGPAGSPSRGRLDVLPTGRNLTSIDPRAIPTPTAYEIGRRSAEELMMRHAQDHGDWPKRLVADLWGSATMRTGGEQLAEALALLGVKPNWDAATGRVIGFTILPEAKLSFPRVDVTLRVSGLFRDVFPGSIALFDAAVQAVARLDEAATLNPIAANAVGEDRIERIFGSLSGTYGAGGLATTVITDEDVTRDALGAAYVNTATHALSAHGEVRSTEFGARVAGADAYVHTMDLADVDSLSGDAFVDHVGGFSAAAQMLGAAPALYVQDATDPARPKTRTLSEDLSRTIRARAANPRWIAGQMRHGHRGAAEIAESIEAAYAFAVTAEAVTSSQFDLLFEATLGTEAVRAFLLSENPLAARAIATAFDRAQRRGFWQSRRNSTGRILTDILGVAA
jgi:cobaltochelatase CobN